MLFERGGHRALDGRGRVRLHQPQHPDPFLVGLARVLGQLGPHLLPHRRQPPVGKRRRLGHRPVLAFQQRQHMERIKDLRAPAEHAAMLRHHLGADGDRHPVVVQLHPRRPVGVADRYRVGDVVHADVSELVGHPRDDAAGGGKMLGQRPQMLPLQRQGFLRRAPVVEVAQRQVGLQLGEDRRVERRPALDRQPRPEHQIPCVFDASLHRTLLPALGRRAELGPERIRAPERLECFGLHPVPAGQDLLDRKRRVIEDDASRCAPEIEEGGLDTVEQRLEPLDRVRLGEVRVRVRQRCHQVLDLARRPGEVDPRFPEVDLHRRAGKRAAVHEGLLRFHLALQRRNVTAYSALGDRPSQRQQQPPDPLRRQPRVVVQPLLDLLPPGVQTPDPLRRHAHRRCRPAYGPPDRLDVQLQPPRDFLLRHTLHQMQVADFGPLRHPDHLRVLLALSRRDDPVSPRLIIARESAVPGCSGGPF